MDVICVATRDSRVYYSILVRLKKSGLSFKSIIPSEVKREKCSLVLTSKRESALFEGDFLEIEDLNESPLIMKGQILAKLAGSGGKLLVGIDPGSRIGVALYYRDVKLASLTFTSISELVDLLRAVVQSIPHGSLIVKVGDGAPRLSKLIIKSVRSEIDEAVVETVDEKGTSVNYSRSVGMTRDQLAAAKIAHRKGVVAR